MIGVANSWFAVARTGTIALLALLFCAQPPGAAESSETLESDTLDSAPALEPCVMEEAGYWQGRIFGTATFDVGWSGDQLECAGHARPGGDGLRLFFAGHPHGRRERLLLVLGIAAPLAALAGREHEASVTLIDEAGNQFFHGREGRCFARITGIRTLGGKPHSWRIEGELYCTGAIAAVSGPGSLTLGDMRFAGRFTESPP